MSIFFISIFSCLQLFFAECQKSDLKNRHLSDFGYKKTPMSCFFGISVANRSWTLIFSYLTYNDLIQVSTISRMFYYLCSRSMRFVEKLSCSRTHFWCGYFWLLQGLFFVICWTIALCTEELFWRRCLFLPKKNFLWLNLFSVSFLFVCSINCFAALQAIAGRIFVSFVQGLMLNKKIPLII